MAWMLLLSGLARAGSNTLPAGKEICYSYPANTTHTKFILNFYTAPSTDPSLFTLNLNIDQQLFKTYIPKGPILETVKLPDSANKRICLLSKAPDTAAVYFVFQHHDYEQQAKAKNVSKSNAAAAGLSDSLVQIFDSTEQTFADLQRLKNILRQNTQIERVLLGSHQGFSRLINISLMAEIPILVGLMIAQYLRLRNLLAARCVI